MLDFDRTILENMLSAKSDLREPEARNVLGSFLFIGDDVHKPVKVLSGGERTRLALATLVVSSANVLLLDEPTNNLDPASREEILGALAEYQGAVVLVSHDEGAVQALKPERVILLPDGDEDIWKEEYFDLVSID
jgi:ATPase subunit of ABC transporter with duplicated ATPase domains